MNVTLQSRPPSEAAGRLINAISVYRQNRSPHTRRIIYRQWFDRLRSQDYRQALRGSCAGIDPVLDRLLLERFRSEEGSGA